MPSSQLQDTLRRESQRSYAVRIAKINSVSASNLASHRVVICGALSGILHSRHRRCHWLLLLLSRTTSTVSRASRRKIARFKNSFMSRTSYEPSGIVISALFAEINRIYCSIPLTSLTPTSQSPIHSLSSLFQIPCSLFLYFG